MGTNRLRLLSVGAMERYNRARLYQRRPISLQKCRQLILIFALLQTAEEMLRGFLHNISSMGRQCRIGPARDWSHARAPRSISSRWLASAGLPAASGSSRPSWPQIAHTLRSSGYAFVVIELQWHARAGRLESTGFIMSGEHPAHVPDSIVAELRGREVSWPRAAP
mgnify:CR=1 FL=1